jgi:hypothetical protein
VLHLRCTCVAPVSHLCRTCVAPAHRACSGCRESGPAPPFGRASIAPVLSAAERSVRPRPLPANEKERRRHRDKGDTYDKGFEQSRLLGRLLQSRLRPRILDSPCGRIRSSAASQPCAAATLMGRRARLSIHGPDRTAERIHCAIGDSPPTFRVGRNLHEHRRAGGLFVSSTRDRGRGGPLSRSGQLAKVDVTSGG